MSETVHSHRKPLNQAVGEAIEAYANVEAQLAFLLQALLQIDVNKAYAILFAIQNSRLKNELFQFLLLEGDPALKKYWASCGKFLLTLAQVRNAVAHWHPYIDLYATDDAKVTKAVPVLGHPIPGFHLKSLEPKHLSLFVMDCRNIRAELSSLTSIVKTKPSTLPGKFQKPIAHRNQAVLRSRLTPKERQPQRPPSQPSALQKRGQRPSAKQRRQRALANLKKKQHSST